VGLEEKHEVQRGILVPSENLLIYTNTKIQFFFNAKAGDTYTNYDALMG